MGSEEENSEERSRAVKWEVSEVREGRGVWDGTL
jgi:hypothetical protein